MHVNPLICIMGTGVIVHVNPLICIMECNIVLKLFNVNTETIKLAGEALLPSAFCEQPGLSTQLLAVL